MTTDPTNSRVIAESSAASLRLAASILGSTGVALGAVGAHAMKDLLLKRNTLTSWHTATNYQLFHSVAILGVAALVECHANVNDDVGNKVNRLVRAGHLMALGSVFFSGSIYCLSTGVGPSHILGPTTPLGGLLMIAGWIYLGLA